MNLTAIAKSGAALAMDIAGDAKVKAVLHLGKVQAGDYNYNTDSVDDSTVAGGSNRTVYGVLYRSQQQQKEATGNNAMFLIEGADVPSGSIDEADTITIEGAIWQVSMVEPVPTKAIILLRLRK